MNFNNKKNAVKARERLKTYSDDKIEQIVNSVDLYNIYKHDIECANSYLSAAFADLVEQRNLSLMVLYLDKIEEYLRIDILEKILANEYMCKICADVIKENIKGFYDNDVLLEIARRYAPFCNSKEELSIFIMQIKLDAYTKMDYLSKNKIVEEIEKVINAYDELFEQRKFLISAIDEVFGLDGETWLEGGLNKEEIEKKERNVKLFNYRDLEKLANDNGYQLVRVKGSHHIFKKEEERENLTIPKHSKDLGKGLSVKIQKQINGDR